MCAVKENNLEILYFLLKESKIYRLKSNFDLKKDVPAAGVQVHDSTVRCRLLVAGQKALRLIK
jgi:hypothetical protein